MTLKEIVDVFSALLTPVTTMITVYIAWQQHKVSRSILRKDLYEKRLRIYQVFMSYLSEIARNRNVNYNRVMQFYAESSECEFLFTAEIVKKADELYQKGIEFSHLNNQLNPSDGSNGLSVGEQRSIVVREESELYRWFTDQISNTRELLREEMSIQESRMPSLVTLNIQKINQKK
ncbi:hypothetical protein [Chamaesiphon polymorphus]|uniref:Uncharacterized protein n=1 Tax=Chamaesiphon polymorphus CCALA 037 TaxID=2107692 RepID=A0A2T1GGM4_9CYAN|nr:hypothetical protein [Chamaesiphon polymorphus]PSB56758.1 hypothetical protein C7B77_10775 [Chamaesiphon polymorphus CCALA 037]